MKESYREGSATRPGLESCIGGREVSGEARTKVYAGQPLSCEIRKTRVPMQLSNAEGHAQERDQRRALPGPCAVVEPEHA